MLVEVYEVEQDIACMLYLCYPIELIDLLVVESMVTVTVFDPAPGYRDLSVSSSYLGILIYSHVLIGTG